MRRMPLNAEELEKIRYIEDSYDFTSEQLQDASKEPKYAKLITLMNEASKNWCGAVLINDLTNQTLYTGTYNDNNIELYSVTSNSIEFIEISYDKSTDDMEINDIAEVLLTEDYIKTIFGQNIVGTGDITLHRHQILVRLTSTDTTCFTYYSTSDLKVDSVQDLRTLLGGNEWTIGVSGRFTIDRVNDINGVSVNLVSSGTQLSLYYIKIDGSFNIANALGATISDVVTPMTTLTAKEAKE